MNDQGILVLSHCGFSFVEKLKEISNRYGLRFYVLSSLPEKNIDERTKELKKISHALFMTSSHDLTTEDVINSIESLQRDGLPCSAVITVWEGYRHLMARANRMLSIPDSSENSIISVTDKLEVRNHLYNKKLGSFKAELLTENNFKEITNSTKSKFIKPRRGISSFGTFRMRPEVCWQDISRLVNQMAKDPVINSVSSNEITFIAEDFIDGIEVSFEVIGFDNKFYILAIHEKLQTTHHETTVLEDKVICPPMSINKNDIRDGICWLKSVLASFNMENGCFHVEAKFNNKKWEIIEINPRVGGSLISQSVSELNGGESILDLWIQTLLCKEEDYESLHNKLIKISYPDDGQYPFSEFSYFKVYYSLSGIIAKIKIDKTVEQPKILEVLVNVGTTFISNDKENFIGHALWKAPIDNLKSEIEKLIEASEQLITVDVQDLLEEVG